MACAAAAEGPSPQRGDDESTIRPLPYGRKEAAGRSALLEVDRDVLAADQPNRVDDERAAPVRASAPGSAPPDASSSKLTAASAFAGGNRVWPPG